MKEDEATFMQRTMALMHERKEILLAGKFKGAAGFEISVSITFRQVSHSALQHQHACFQMHAQCNLFSPRDWHACFSSIAKQGQNNLKRHQHLHTLPNRLNTGGPSSREHELLVAPHGLLAVSHSPKLTSGGPCLALSGIRTALLHHCSERSPVWHPAPSTQHPAQNLYFKSSSWHWQIALALEHRLLVAISGVLQLSTHTGWHAS